MQREVADTSPARTPTAGVPEHMLSASLLWDDVLHAFALAASEIRSCPSAPVADTITDSGGERCVPSSPLVDES